MAVPQSATPKFLPDDPLLVDHDKLDTPDRPASIKLSDMYDRFGHIIAGDVGGDAWGEAENINTLDEVPDSSWFTNRHGVERMTIDELVRGPNMNAGPDTSGPWIVFASKSQGLTPGFQIRDPRGDRYVIKLDPVDIPELASAAEVIATKLFYAMGYFAPQNFIVRVHPDQFEIEPGTTVEDAYGDESELTTGRMRRLLRHVPRLPDGRIRVTASRYVSGIPIGPFRYFGTRSDDPNDVIPHEQRRELRGLRLMAAWTNHDDTRAHNTLDSWVEDDGVHYVRHHLLDFGSTFGSGSVEHQLPNLGFHYWLDPALVKKNLFGFGLSVPKYRKVNWPDFAEHGAVGRWESKAYTPEDWRNDYPNPAFLRMTNRDAFWAAKIIMRFTAEELAAIVGTGEYSDPAQEAYFLDTLVERQRKSAEPYMQRVNPLDRFEVTAEGLRFVNLAEEYGFASPDTTYRIQWSRYDNASDTTDSIGELASQRATEVSLPDVRTVTGPQHYLLAEIHSLHDTHPAWDSRIGVYLRRTPDGFRIVGIERQS